MGSQKPREKGKSAQKRTTILVCIIVVLLFFCMPSIINCIASIPNPHVVGDPNSVEATWIGFLGDYIGGIFSTLIGAGISGLVAYKLIGKEIRENNHQQTLSTFSMDFNTDFQKVKNGIIASITDIHMVLQFYHAGLSDVDAFMNEYNAKMSTLHQTNIDLVQLINKHVLLLSYVKDQTDQFDPNLNVEQLNNVVLFFNDMRINFASNNDGQYDLIADYNKNGIPKVNDFRTNLVRNEKAIISILFPVLSSKRDFTLSKMTPIIETSYEGIMQRYGKQMSDK